MLLLSGNAVDHFIPNEGQHWVAVPFIVAIKNGQEPRILEPHKCEAIGWFDLEHLPSPLSTVTEPTIQTYLRSMHEG